MWATEHQKPSEHAQLASTFSSAAIIISVRPSNAWLSFRRVSGPEGVGEEAGAELLVDVLLGVLLVEWLVEDGVGVDEDEGVQVLLGVQVDEGVSLDHVDDGSGVQVEDVVWW